MKYLRKCFESLDLEELRDFSETYLAYLIDDGFKVRIYGSGIWLVKSNNDSNIIDIIGFFWDDIKDYYIPFLNMLSKNYELGFFNGVSQKPVRINWSNGEPDIEEFSYKNVINDNIFNLAPKWNVGKFITDGGHSSLEKMYSIGVKIKNKL